MDKKIAGLLGAVSACLVLDGAAAVASPASLPAQPQSYADLLQPIPNATRLLAANDADLAARAPADQNTQVADTIIIKKRTRHRRHHHHHHHHHHHNG